MLRLARLELARHVLVNLHRLGQLSMVHAVDLGHVPLPVVLAGESLASLPRVVAARHRAVELLLLLMAVVDVPLQMRLGTEALAARGVRTLVVFAVVAPMVPVMVSGLSNVKDGGGAKTAEK